MFINVPIQNQEKLITGMLLKLSDFKTKNDIITPYIKQDR
jgi:hypothetical protein